MSGWNKMLARLVKDSGVKFTLHDLRRSFRTGLSQIGIDTETAELALGHAREHLVEIYDRTNGSARVRAAFHAWSWHIESLIAKNNAPQKELVGVFA